MTTTQGPIVAGPVVVLTCAEGRIAGPPMHS